MSTRIRSGKSEIEKSRRFAVRWLVEAWRVRDPRSVATMLHGFYMFTPGLSSGLAEDLKTLSALAWEKVCNGGGEA